MLFEVNCPISIIILIGQLKSMLDSPAPPSPHSTETDSHNCEHSYETARACFDCWRMYCIPEKFLCNKVKPFALT